MFTISNVLSFLRLPLALLFFQGNPLYRAAAILLAMLSDGLDGYLARRFNQVSRLGTYLDPITDKLFVFITLNIFVFEERLFVWQALAMISRDLALMLFAIYLAIRGRISEHRVRAIWWGKISTALQFMVLLTLVFYGALSFYVYLPFILFGFLAFIELYCSLPSQNVQKV